MSSPSSGLSFAKMDEFTHTPDFVKTVSSRDVPQLSTLFEQEPPSFRTFSLKVEPSDADDEDEVPTLPNDIFGGLRPPNLLHLSLQGCRILFNSPLLYGLTTLSLDTPVRPTHWEFISGMNNMTSLERLSFSGCLPWSLLYHADEVLCNMPRLKQLALHDDILVCIGFLRVLRSHPVKLEVTGDTGGHDCDVIFEECSRLLLPKLESSPFFHLTINTALLPERGSGLQIQATSEIPVVPFGVKVDSQITLSLSLTIPERMPSDLDLKVTIKSAVQLLPLHNVAILEVDIHLPAINIYSDILSPNLPNLRGMCCSPHSLVRFFLGYKEYLEIARFITREPYPPAHLIPFNRLRRIFGKLTHPERLHPVVYQVLLSRRAVNCPIALYNLHRVLLGSPRSAVMTV